MKHLDEEELIEHYYGEDRDPGASARHIDECAECAADYAALQADLSDLKDSDLPFRDAAYGQRVWESIAPWLRQQRERGILQAFLMRPVVWRGLAYAAAIAALVAVTFYAGRMWEHSQAPATAAKPPTPAPQPPSQPQRMVVVVLSDHLDRSERLLVELKHADAGSPDMLSPLRDEARTLLPANRICEQEAESSDDPQLEKALASLDRLLTGLAGQPDGLNAAALARLQEEMKAEGLLFEVRVLRSRMPARAPENKHTL